MTADFLHADLDKKEKAYIKIPLGFCQKGKVLKLKKTLYGLHQIPYAFWQFLTNAMVASGMKLSKLDPCLFMGDNVTAIAFVDDILFWAKDEAYINKLAIKLCSQGLLVEQEDDAARFFGVEMTRREEDLMEMKQRGLID